MLVWSKQASDWKGSEGPFAAVVAPKGDGRWNWSVYGDGAERPQASGIASSLGGAKNACELYVKRTGRI